MSEWRRMFSGREWRVVPTGMESRPPLTHHRTRGEPATMRLYWTAWRTHLEEAERRYGVPPAILLATVATENGPGFRLPDGQPLVRPAREEPGYISDRQTPHRISIGPCHVLISTARDTMRDQNIDRAWLSRVDNNLMAAAAYIAAGKESTGWDPILVAARYNSGGLYDASARASRWYNHWHLRSTKGHLDRFADWYGDVVEVLGQYSAAPATTPRPITVEITVEGQRYRGDLLPID